jgi:hypothetical protein
MSHVYHWMMASRLACKCFIMLIVNNVLTSVKAALSAPTSPASPLILPSTTYVHLHLLPLSRVFTLLHTNDKPIWLHCEQAAGTNVSHCGRGMVAAINPTADKTFDAFKQNALNVGAALSANSSMSLSTPMTHEVQVGGDEGSLVYVPSVTVCSSHPVLRDIQC